MSDSLFNRVMLMSWWLFSLGPPIAVGVGTPISLAIKGYQGGIQTTNPREYAKAFAVGSLVSSGCCYGAYKAFNSQNLKQRYGDHETEIISGLIFALSFGGFSYSFGGFCAAIQRIIKESK